MACREEREEKKEALDKIELAVNSRTRRALLCEWVWTVPDWQGWMVIGKWMEACAGRLLLAVPLIMSLHQPGGGWTSPNAVMHSKFSILIIPIVIVTRVHTSQVGYPGIVG